MRPHLSLIVCTYNGENLIKRCIDSILIQDYKNFEILCIDGGSKDKTLEIIRNYSKKDKRIRIIINKNRLPEGAGNGKWQGFTKSKGKIIGIIDQDNVLQDSNLFSKIVNLMHKEDNLVGVLGGLRHDLSDHMVLRYVSLFGTDSFFAYRSVDFLNNLKGRKHDIEKINLYIDNMSLTGGNCFFYLKESIEKAGGYTRDVDTIRRIILSGKNKLLILKDSTKHYAETSLFNLVKKKFMWGIKYFLEEETDSFNYLPKTKKELALFSKNLIFNLLIFPNLIYSFKIYKNYNDTASFLFPQIAFLNTLAYGINFLAKKLSR